MIVWINGTLGLGKTTTSSRLVEADTRAGTAMAARHVEVYHSALAWLRPAADLVIDTWNLAAVAASQQVRAAVETRL